MNSEMSDKGQHDLTQLSNQERLKISDLFKTLGDPSRLRIIEVLSQVEELSVDDLANQVGLTQSAASHQLRRLKLDRVVKYRKEGKFIYYSLADQHLLYLFNIARDHVQENDIKYLI